MKNGALYLHTHTKTHFYSYFETVHNTFVIYFHDTKTLLQPLDKVELSHFELDTFDVKAFYYFYDKCKCIWVTRAYKRDYL